MRSKFNPTSNDKCPCKGCVPPQRALGCHSICQPYIDWLAEHQQKVEYIRQQRELTNLCFDSALRRNKQLLQKGASFGRSKGSNGTR